MVTDSCTSNYFFNPILLFSYNEFLKWIIMRLYLILFLNLLSTYWQVAWIYKTCIEVWQHLDLNPAQNNLTFEFLNRNLRVLTSKGEKAEWVLNKCSIIPTLHCESILNNYKTLFMGWLKHCSLHRRVVGSIPGQGESWRQPIDIHSFSAPPPRPPPFLVR